MTSTERAATVPTAVRKSIQVAAPPDVAFRVFTAGMSKWWPLATHKLGKAAAVEAVIEPRVGGRWFERGEDGSQVDWGRVLVWDPPRGLVLSWQISCDFQPDPTLHTEVEVRFAPHDGGTRVELEHRLLDRYGEDAGKMAAMFDAPGGWGGLLERFAGAAKAA